MEWISDPEMWIALATLTTLEVVLGIDNVIFISILASKLPVSQQLTARRVGLAVAMGARILLLFSLSWIIRFTEPIMTFGGRDLSGRDLTLIAGGLFLLAKATYEIHDKLEGEEGHKSSKVTASFASVVLQIMVLDVVFSLDSVITAVGMVDDVGIMVAAVVIAIVVMIACVGSVSRFVMTHPSIKTLALSFLVMIGILLMADGLGQHLPRGYIYFAMVFSLLVELINLRIAARRKNPKLS